jgi:hypothetical protein
MICLFQSQYPPAPMLCKCLGRSNRGSGEAGRRHKLEQLGSISNWMDNSERLSMSPGFLGIPGSDRGEVQHVFQSVFTVYE